MTNKLERKQNKVIFGVAAGLADYFNVDVTMLRLVLVALMFLDGSGVVAISYLLAAWLMPKEWDAGDTPAPSAKEQEAYAASG